MKRLAGPLTIAVLVASPLPAAMAGGTTTTREFQGTVVSVDRDSRTFRLRDDGRVVTIKVTRTTTFERIAGFAGLRSGLSRVEADVRRSGKRWVARHVELSGRDRGDDDRDRRRAGLRQFEGTVLSVNRDRRTFRLRDDGRTVTIRVTRRTTFDDIAGFAGLRAGMQGVEADVRRSRGRWIARHIDLDDEDDDNSGPGDGDRDGDGGNSGPG